MAAYLACNPLKKSLSILPELSTLSTWPIENNPIGGGRPRGQKNRRSKEAKDDY